jgi:hypothetical protein
MSMSMNKNWDTPPGGDFATYVERLTARSARAVLSPASSQQLSDFGQDDDDDGVAAPTPGGASTPFGRALAPGEMAPQNSLTSGLTAVLGALRDSLERSARNTRQRKEP